MALEVRRIVTGHDTNGKAVIKTDERLPAVSRLGRPHIAGCEIWSTDKNPLGVKGVGEAGTIGSIPAVMNAVNNALASIGAPPVDLPATPEKVWRAMRAAA